LPRVDTEVISHESISAARAAAGSSPGHKTQLTETPLPVRDLPPLTLAPAEIECRPTIFLGVGGLAARTLLTLHQRIESRFGDPAALPALQFLLFETDAESLKTATDAGQAPLPNDSAVLLPLRQSADYRSAQDGRFHWLSRRWIYNIPRNAQTQGLRPLGRLALVDNMERAIEQVTRVIRAAAGPAGIAAAAAATGLPFRHPAPRVFIVSSTTGGTGSGMALDLGYLVRQVLRELQLPDDAVCGVLAHCTGRNPQTRELSTANAHALLGELNHYADRHHFYPGDPAVGLASCGAEDRPFNHAYLVHLGEELDADGFAAAVDTLATYLYHNSVTTAAAFFDQCRAAQAADKSSAGADPTLRTFGICQLGFSPDDLPRSAADDLCCDLITRWRGAELNQPASGSASLSDPTSLLATQFTRGISAEELRATVVARAEAAAMTLHQVVDRFRTVLAERMGNDRPSYLLAALGELLNNLDRAPSTQGRSGFLARTPPAKVLVEALDAMIRYQGAADSHRLCLESALEVPVREMAAAAGAEMQQWLLGLVNSPEHRLAGAQQMADGLAEHLRGLSNRAGEAIRAATEQLRSLKELLLGDKKGSKNWLRFRGFFSRRRLVADRRLSEYFELRLQELTLDAFCRLVGLVLAQVATVGDKLRNLAADFNRLIEQFSAPPAVVGELSGRTKALQEIAAAQIAARKTELLLEMERALEEELAQAATTDTRDVRSKLAVVVRRTARTLILRKLEQFAAEQAAAALQGQPHEPLFEISAGLKEALPRRLIGCGGQQRLLMVVPDQLAPLVAAQVAADGGSLAPTVMADAASNMPICYEVEEQPLRRVAAKLLDQRFQAVEVAARLHTRSDVPWTPL
jgi:hypothetical protein